MTSENGVNEIKSKILKTEPVYWEKLKYIQNENFKELSKDAYKKLKQSILNNDYVMPFAVWQDKDSVYVIDGVHRCRVLTELKKEGYLIPATFPANFLDCKNRKEAAKLVLVYSSAYAKTTDEGLYEFLNLEDMNFDELKLEIDIPDIDLDKFEQGYLKDTDSEKLDAVPEVQKEAVSQLGDLFVIDGKHRVLCGDATDSGHVEALMQGNRANLYFTDPPYSVNYSKKAKEVLKSSNYVEIQNDNLTVSETCEKLWKPVFKNAYEACTDDASFYLTMPQGGDQMMMMMMMMMNENWLVKHELIWVKDTPVFSMGRLDYDYMHEPIAYGWKKKHNFYHKGQYQKSVWNIKRTENKLHPTMKPVALIQNAIMNSTMPNCIVLDTFLGSGSALIACQQTERICYGLELDPIYIDVILKRYKTLYPNADIKCNREDFNFEKLWQDQEKK